MLTYLKYHIFIQNTTFNIMKLYYEIIIHYEISIVMKTNDSNSMHVRLFSVYRLRVILLKKKLFMTFAQQ